MSVLLDGSWVRGDFWPGVSDLDVTSTFADGASGMAEGLIAIREWLDERARALPTRPVGRRPLRFDLQGQTLDEVMTTARRPLSVWSADDVPTGYPKLWLHTFDGIRHHTVLYGVTCSTVHVFTADGIRADPARAARAGRSGIGGRDFRLLGAWLANPVDPTIIEHMRDGGLPPKKRHGSIQNPVHHTKHETPDNYEPLAQTGPRQEKGRENRPSHAIGRRTA